MKNILKTALVLGLSVSMISPAAVMAGPKKIKTTEKKSESDTKSVTGITHADSYEELYELLKKQNESTTAGANARGIAMYAEEDTMDAVAETAVESTDTGSSSSGYSGEIIDPGFTYDKESDHSDTNTQEENVDEADIVKTDGKYIYAMDSRGDIHIVDAESMEVTGEVTGISSADYQEMYVNGDTLQLIFQQEEYMTYQGELETSSSTVRSSYSVPITTVKVETYDITDRSNPEKTGSYSQDGAYLSSRRYDGCLYLYTSFTPDTGSTPSQLEYYVPRSNAEYIDCDNIYYPVVDITEDCSWNQKDFLVAGAVQDENPKTASDIMAVVSGGETFYVSENNVYSAVTTWNDQDTRTEIVRIGYKDGRFTDGSTGSVSGELNNNFSMNEYDGNLRLVTTTEGWDKDYTEYNRDNGLYILDKDMTTIGKIENLAEGEEIKSARFMGDTGYFVTYENTDPLFSADLSDPENPIITGKLKITGFSEYLHFYGQNRLLGIGWETDPDSGSTEGLKCSMFDISDPSEVKEIDRIILKDVTDCDALSNYRAILASVDKNLFGFAYGVYKNTGAGNYYSYNGQDFYYYGLFSYSEDGFTPETYLNFADTGLFDEEITTRQFRTSRGVYVRDTFFLVTDKGIAAYDMADGYSFLKAVTWDK